MLKTKFQTLCETFTQQQTIINGLWEEIEKRHSQPSRYYHTLKHLEQFYQELPLFDTVTEFAIFYHDSIYNASKSNNEEESALFFEKQVTFLNIPTQFINEVSQLINETKTHTATSQRNALFLDADLAILGTDLETYRHYTQNIRKEYAIYPDTVYQEGRKKVLTHFLNKKRIYLSDYFYELYEEKAHRNLTWELKQNLN
jgi:predicted metal-dependent HD superfamily phosphohydrolase